MFVENYITNLHKFLSETDLLNKYLVVQCLMLE